MLNLSLQHAQDADDEDLPPLEEDVDEGSRMEVRCCLLSFVIMQYAWHSTLSSLLCSTMLQAVFTCICALLHVFQHKGRSIVGR